MDLFADHSFSFAPGAFAAAHQLHHPQRNHAICFQCQHHQRVEHPLPSRQLSHQDERSACSERALDPRNRLGGSLSKCFRSSVCAAHEKPRRYFSGLFRSAKIRPCPMFLAAHQLCQNNTKRRMIGSGTPNIHNKAPLPKPMTCSTANLHYSIKPRRFRSPRGWAVRSILRRAGRFCWEQTSGMMNSARSRIVSVVRPFC
jgi:hypothetical protein